MYPVELSQGYLDFAAALGFLPVSFCLPDACDMESLVEAFVPATVGKYRFPANGANAPTILEPALLTQDSPLYVCMNRKQGFFYATNTF